jgi:hypothetical protein
LRWGEWLLPVAPRVVGDEPADMVQQVAHPNPRRIVGRVAPAAHLRDMLFGEVVEAELALVAQRQDGERGERLAHRGDAEAGLRLDRRAARVAPSFDAQMRQPPVEHDSIDDAGYRRFRLEVIERAVDRGK